MPRITRGQFVLVLGVGALVGMLSGIGSFTFVYARGASYMTNDPRACANCHVMNEQYDGWMKSSHHNVATCNDCHTPHNFVGKYYTKALNGYNHSFAFTTGRFHEPIKITARNRSVTQGACRSCHADIVAQIDHGVAGRTGTETQIDCIQCHRNVGHLHE